MCSDRPPPHIGCRLHFRQLSAGHDDPLRFHARATYCTVLLKWSVLGAVDQAYSFTMHILGNVVGVLVSRDAEEFIPGACDVFMLYNWVTGVKIAVSAPNAINAESDMNAE